MKIKLFIELYKNFSPKIAISSALASSFRYAAPLKHRCILDYLKKNYSDFISDYKNRKVINNADSSEIIWTMWWQSDNDFPEVVKMCLSSINKYCGVYPLKIITKNNYKEFVNLPDYILEKVKEGSITITHFSDIVRFYLLYNYGGLWLDSTVFVTGEIPESIFKSEYYTVKRPLTPKNRNIAQDRWTNFLHASKKDNFLCGFILDFFLEYWKTQKTLIDYFLIDYAIQIAYDEFPKCRELLDSVPLVNYDLYKFENIMNKEWSVETWSSIKNSTLFSKLAWRKEGKKETLLGKETIYGHIAKNYENQK